LFWKRVLTLRAGKKTLLPERFSLSHRRREKNTRRKRKKIDKGWRSQAGRGEKKRSTARRRRRTLREGLCALILSLHSG